jgi:hypothetical protein
MGELVAALVQGLPVPPAMAQWGVRAADLAPSREILRKSGLSPDE